MNVATGTHQLQLVKQLLKGQALTMFQTILAESINTEWETQKEVARATECANPAHNSASILQAVSVVVQPPPGPLWIASLVLKVLEYMAPHKALAKQKRYLRCLPVSQTQRHEDTCLCQPFG